MSVKITALYERLTRDDEMNSIKNQKEEQRERARQMMITKNKAKYRGRSFMKM